MRASRIVSRVSRGVWFTCVLVAAGRLGGAVVARAQGDGVPIYTRPGSEAVAIKLAAEKMRDAGRLVRETVLTNQFIRRSCALTLPEPRRQPLTSRDLWAIAHAAHLRVGWYFQCSKCRHWHLELAAGYPLTADGVVATCFHVIEPPRLLSRGYLIAAAAGGAVYPVQEILAANPPADVAILRIAGDQLTPLPLSTNVYPGDRCVCLSDPLGEEGYYSEGIVSRFLHPHNHDQRNPSVLRLNVTTDWAKGSSGAAVLDAFGNAVGHVTSIAALSDRQGNHEGEAPRPVLITLHEAVSARDVLALIRPGGPSHDHRPATARGATAVPDPAGVSP
ncbi:MAG TPA: serine protease [Verrucomicrobiota bacterium]|nr:serine protease [Verrucomicrobiota bacterium]HNT14569.1 serine protease [Verrucomicrobiota bacterium]